MMMMMVVVGMLVMVVGEMLVMMVISHPWKLMMTAGLHESFHISSRAVRKWRENEEMRRKWRENEEMERD